MKITREGELFTVDFEDGKDQVTLDVGTLSEDVRTAAMLFGFQTALRNSTAGKLEEMDKARASLTGRVKTWSDGAWLSVAESKAAIELTKEERQQVIGQVVILARRAQGDARTDAEILGAFNGLADERKQAVLKALEKPIDKRLKDALRQKKSLAKGAGSVPTF